MGREGIQKVAVLVESGIGNDAEQFIPLRSVLNGNVGLQEAIDGTFTEGTGAVSAVIENPANRGVHMFVNFSAETVGTQTVNISILGIPEGLTSHLERAFRPLIGPQASTMNYHVSLNDDTVDPQEQRLAGILPSRFQINLFVSASAGGTATVSVNFALAT